MSADTSAQSHQRPLYRARGGRWNRTEHPEFAMISVLVGICAYALKRGSNPAALSRPIARRSAARSPSWVMPTAVSEYYGSVLGFFPQQPWQVTGRAKHKRDFVDG